MIEQFPVGLVGGLTQLMSGPVEGSQLQMSRLFPVGPEREPKQLISDPLPIDPVREPQQLMSELFSVFSVREPKQLMSEQIPVGPVSEPQQLMSEPFTVGPVRGPEQQMYCRKFGAEGGPQQQMAGKFPLGSIGGHQQQMSGLFPFGPVGERQQHLRPLIRIPSFQSQQTRDDVNPRGISVDRAQNRPSFADVNKRVDQVPSDEWPYQMLVQSPDPVTDHQLPQNLLVEQPLAAAAPIFYGGNLMLPKPRTSAQAAQRIVQMKKRGEQRHPQKKADNVRKKRHPLPRALDRFLDVEVNKPVDEIESYFCIDDENAEASNETYPSGCNFEDVISLYPTKYPLLCCQFSPDGKLLASAGHEKKVYIFDMERTKYIEKSEHSLRITDVRFRPNSTFFATSSFDKTVRVWDANLQSPKSLLKLSGHAEEVLSLDFNPRKVDRLCSCDRNDEIILWNVHSGKCMKVCKGATNKVRFQPQYGKLLAAASGNIINIIDIDNDSSVQFSLQGHAKEVLSLSWNSSGTHIASVSEDSARVWSLAKGRNCEHELHSSGNKFQSCVFDPVYPQRLIIGGNQSLELWNPTDGCKTKPNSRNVGLIFGLDSSLASRMVASTSQEGHVKLWQYL